MNNLMAIGITILFISTCFSILNTFLNPNKTKEFISNVCLYLLSFSVLLIVISIILGILK